MPYILDPNADISGTSWVADIKIPPIEVVRAFGTPRTADRYKVSGLFSFTQGADIFTLYDWKSTALYNKELPSSLEFWNSRSDCLLSIGSNGDVIKDFKVWLIETVRAGGLSG